jgi:hypothetical protein
LITQRANMTNQVAQAASPPTLAKNARKGQPLGNGPYRNR